MAREKGPGCDAAECFDSEKRSGIWRGDLDFHSKLR